MVRPAAGQHVAGGDGRAGARRADQASLAESAGHRPRRRPDRRAGRLPGLRRPAARGRRRRARGRPGPAQGGRRGAPRRPLDGVRPRTRRHGAGTGLVPGPGHRPASARPELLLRHRPPRHRGGRQRQVRVGAVAPPAPDRARGRLPPRWRRAVRRGRRHAAPLLVGGQPVPVRHPLDQRHRARRAAAVLGLDPPAARRLGRGRAAVRGQPHLPAAAPSPPGVAGPAAEPRVVGQQPPPGRDGRAVRRGLRVPLVPGEQRLARGGRHHAPARARPADVRQRPEPRAGHRLPRLRARARPGRRPRGRAGRPSARRPGLGHPAAHDRRPGRRRRRAPAPAPPGRRRRRPRPAAGRARL